LSAFSEHLLEHANVSDIIAAWKYSRNTLCVQPGLFFRGDMSLFCHFGRLISSLSRDCPRISSEQQNYSCHCSRPAGNRTVPSKQHNCCNVAWLHSIRTMRPRVSDGEPSPNEWMVLVNHLALRNINCALQRTERLSSYELLYVYTLAYILLRIPYLFHYSFRTRVIARND